MHTVHTADEDEDDILGITIRSTPSPTLNSGRDFVLFAGQSTASLPPPSLILPGSGKGHQQNRTKPLLRGVSSSARTNLFFGTSHLLVLMAPSARL